MTLKGHRCVKLSKLESLLESLRLISMKESTAKNRGLRGIIIEYDAYEEFIKNMNFLTACSVVKSKSIGEIMNCIITPKGERVLTFFNMLPQII
jgi:hypothetical protein